MRVGRGGVGGGGEQTFTWLGTDPNHLSNYKNQLSAFYQFLDPPVVLKSSKNIDRVQTCTYQRNVYVK